MSSNASEPRVELALRPQLLWLALLLVSHALALVATLVAGIIWPIQLLLCLLIAASLPFNAKRYWLLSTSHAIRRVEWSTDGRWTLRDNSGEVPGTLVDYYLGTRLVILKFRRHPAVLLWCGRKPAPMVRRLRVRMRHGRMAPQEKAGFLCIGAIRGDR